MDFLERYEPRKEILDMYDATGKFFMDFWADLIDFGLKSHFP